MQYLLHDLIKLPLEDRIYIIERAISSLSNNEVDLSGMIRFLEDNCSKSDKMINTKKVSN